MPFSLIRRSLAVAALVWVSSALLFAAAEGNFDRTLKVTGAVDMDLSTGSGRVTVKTGPAGTITIHGNVRANDSWFRGEGAEERVERIIKNPPIEQNGNVIHIGRLDDPELRRNIAISYDVVVPAETRLVSKTGSGDQTIDGIHGPLEFSTGSGSLKAANIGAEVRASDGSGDVTLDAVNGSVHATTGSGRISAQRISGGFDGGTGSGDVRVQQTGEGNVKVSTGSGRVEVAGVKGGLVVGTGSGDIDVQGQPTAGWKVETGSGTVKLQLPSNAAFDLFARSSSGRIDVNHPLTMEGAVGRHEVRGKVRGGGYLLEVRTASGDITVR